ncbi:hypothetical protein ACLB1M_24020 [Escherichia coli]
MEALTLDLDVLGFTWFYLRAVHRIRKEYAGDHRSDGKTLLEAARGAGLLASFDSGRKSRILSLVTSSPWYYPRRAGDDG